MLLESLLASIRTLACNTGKLSSISSATSKALLTTSSPMLLTPTPLNSSPLTLMLIMVEILTMDDPLVDMWLRWVLVLSVGQASFRVLLPCPLLRQNMLHPPLLVRKSSGYVTYSMNLDTLSLLPPPFTLIIDQHCQLPKILNTMVA